MIEMQDSRHDPVKYGKGARACYYNVMATPPQDLTRT